MINVKMPSQLNPTLSDVVHSWVVGSSEEYTYETDPRIALLRALIHRSDLDADEVKELFFAVYPFESNNFYYNILEYELG
jgi:hypothetical protein